jgi:Zn-dependent protease/predicted transcriptional regulator
MKLFTLFGIEIRLDFSVIFIFGLIVYSLGTGIFPSWHPGWPVATVWTMALTAGLLFFASLLAHEMSHSLVARRFGIRVPRITLFLFGGMAEIETEAETPGAEFAIAIAGPLMSLAIAAACMFYASSAIDDSLLQVIMEDPETGMAEIGPFVTVCLWLGSVNLMLAIFNMVPGFPLDGGRVARAAIWRITGDRLKATEMAANAGRMFGWLIMGLGFWELLALKSMGGLWLVLIGWFLSHLAAQSYAAVFTQNRLAPVTVAELMRTHFERVSGDVTVAHFVDECLLRSSQLLWPVMEADRCVGTASIEEVAKLPMEERSATRVREIALPLEDSGVLDARLPAIEAMGALARRQDRPVLVVADGEVVGLLRGADILKWLTLHGGEHQLAG